MTREEIKQRLISDPNWEPDDLSDEEWEIYDEVRDEIMGEEVEEDENEDDNGEDW